MVAVADLYDAAARAGLLTAVKVGTLIVECGFRTPDETVLDGLALSRDYEIEFPIEHLLLAVGDTVEIAGQLYRVREVIALRDGNECRAKLARLP
ncbi:MAG: hypothetical protein OHM77_07175 [Candidatus Nitricoxidivorans perseverans]|uniref:Transporter-associated domain-containing protein n=1 Tax=Candidatus Nitricoxidivorans perseverans TaxID=2975601 RepID=A0AA49FIW7_9PROT|nr:MAG: hypothetical protein OHM77_07175 [Candidatus Nitricoxidivorans perseverans]